MPVMVKKGIVPPARWGGIAMLQPACSNVRGEYGSQPKNRKQQISTTSPNDHIHRPESMIKVIKDFSIEGQEDLVV